MNKLRPFTRGQIKKFLNILNKNGVYIEDKDITAIEIEYQEDEAIPKIIWCTADGFVGKDSVDKYFNTKEELEKFLEDLF